MTTKRQFIRFFAGSVILLMISPLGSNIPARADIVKIQGDNNVQATDTGVAVNGSANESVINNNQNSLTTGNNTNQNYVSPVLIAPSGGGSGGSSALVLPRNPLALPNANLGRSNFGLQFGVQNNPGLGALSGSENAMGWFLQGGVTIPFGKIPQVYESQATRELDAARQRDREAERQVFGKPIPQTDQNRIETQVNGKVVGLNAYNYTTIPSDKLRVPEPEAFPVETPKAAQPRVLTLQPGDVFSRPLDTGKKIGLVEVGQEYAYLGHIRSGWIKILLPDGQEGWTRAPFEYLKFDFTEIDSLASEVLKPVQAALPRDNKRTR